MPKPRSVRFKQEVRGYCIGCCITGERLPPDIEAHAHISGSEPKWAVGYICARSMKDLRGALYHELAHLIADAGHDDKWRKEMNRLGARIPARHQKRRKE